MLAPEYVEYLRGVGCVGTIVKRDRDLLLFITVSFELIGIRQPGEVLVGDEFRIGIDRHHALARRGTLHDAQDLALSFDGNIRTRGNFGEFGCGIGGARLVPDLPK